ncbi:hypothetical protein NQ317_014432 [Molorchus minor]|uniref:Calponin-homology (CH) domain-containing protein n=1 Tax=Molorchus minor TaxID=1323400 RepID=A0ABQ9K7E2_9CUCU|nr:hypothetical protein NQ317_014432 [Molorchus minor]
MFFQFSPVRVKNQPKPKVKENESEKIEVLSLAPFTHNPKLFFEDITVGDTVSRKLLIQNPSNQDIDILISHNFPQELNVSLNWTEANITRETNVILEVTWTPLKEESSRYTITLNGKKIHRDVHVAFKSILPKRFKTYTVSPETQIYKNRDFKENILLDFLDRTEESNVFISPASATFHLDYLQPIERRVTYIVNGKEKSPDSCFSDSLEAVSPVTTPVNSPNIHNTTDKMPLGVSNRDNVPSDQYTLHFHQRLRNGYLPPLKKVEASQEKNKTFEIAQISSDTYVQSNISTETYVRGNTSFETYIKSNVSGGTYTKDNSVGNIANLSLSPVPERTLTSSDLYSDSNCPDSARGIIESNLWGGINSRPLSAIKEESYIQQTSMTDTNNALQHNFVKTKSRFQPYMTPPKKANFGGVKGWSKSGGAAFRIAKKTTGLNLNKFENKIEEGGKEAVAELTKRDTNVIIIQNPFLLAASNSFDPFMTSHLHINEEWLDQQQIDFKKWVNALLTPPEELIYEEQVIDVAKIWQECKKREIESAPTKEQVSNKYHTNSRLTNLRKNAQNLFRSKEVTSALSKVVLAIESGKLSIRDDKDIHLNLLLRSQIMSMLLSYNPLWLRIGLETVYNELIPLKSNSDMMGLSEFIATRMLKDPYLLRKHKSVHSPRYIAEFKKFFLKKFFVLVYFLDQAKNKKLIPYDPCLFCRKAAVKESKEMLIGIAKEILAAIGDITKYLRHIDYVVTHCQTYLQEFDYAVKNLGVDLRDGIRLTKIMEIILMQDNLTSNLRAPAISRLQKIHNMKIVFDSLEKAGYQILYDITPKDLVDGHKEKTLSFLWQIIYKFQAPLMVKSATTIQTWYKSLPVVLKRRKLERARLRKENAANRIQLWYRRQKLSGKLFEFSGKLRKYLEYVKRERAAIKIQSYFKMYHQRKNVRKHLAKKYYLKLKEAVKVVQTRYRSKQSLKRDRAKYVELRKAVVSMQRRFRANLLAIQVKNDFETLKSATIDIQQRFRANRLCKIERKKYIELKISTIRIQSWYRSILAMRICRQRYLALKKASKFIEERYVAKKCMTIEQNKYQNTRRSCIVIQQRYRAYKAMSIKRNEYLKLKQTVVIVQQTYKAKLEMLRHRQQYTALRTSAILIQRRFRAKKAMQTIRSDYLMKKIAATRIQTWFRATIEMQRHRTYYVSLKHAVNITEERYEAKKLMKLQKINYLRLKVSTIAIQRRYRALLAMRKQRSEYIQLKTVVLFVQSIFRANKRATVQRKQFLKLKEVTLLMQRRYRAQKCMQRARKDYLELKRVTTVVQRRFRANFLMKIDRNYYRKLQISTVFVQQRFKGNRAMIKDRENYTRLRQGCVVIQQRWRAKKCGTIQEKLYRDLKTAVITIQRRWRANKLSRQHRQDYDKLKGASLVLQRRWRANRLAKKARSDYILLKKATIFVQQKWRAKNLGKLQLKSYSALKKATTYIQRIWRANKVCKVETLSFQNLRKSVIIVQNRWRARKMGNEERLRYMQLKKAVAVTQSRWRAKKLGEIYLKEYNALKRSALFVQRKWRANKLATLERTKYQVIKKAAYIIQSKWRAKRLAESQRNSYLELKRATIIVQSRWRAKKIGKEQFEIYRTLLKTVSFVQAKYRANKLTKLEKKRYESLKKTVLLVQGKWRAKKLCERKRTNYLELRTAVINMQRRWRAKQLGQNALDRYRKLKSATVFIQTKWRANRIGKLERTRYQALRKAASNIQSKWRAKILAGAQRKDYLELKRAAIVLQQSWRAKRLGRQQFSEYNALRKAVIYVQQKYRANKLAYLTCTDYNNLRKKVIFVQDKWRATKLAKKERLVYMNLRRVVVVLQMRWRAKKIGQHQMESYNSLKKATVFVQRNWRANKVAKLERTKYEALKKAVVIIQNRWRARRMAISERKSYLELKSKTVFVQRQWRATKLGRRQLESYRKLKKSTIYIQRWYRGYKLTRKETEIFTIKRKAVVNLQRYIRGYLVRRKYAYYFTPEAKEKRRNDRILKHAAIKIQAVWRGHRTRCSETPELLKIRQRAVKANSCAEPQNTLSSRCRVALQALVNEKSTVFLINKSLEDLDFITRHSRNICAQVAQFLPEQMYLMIKTTNRSLPEMTACIYSVNILININKYAVTRSYTFIPEYIDNIVTVMLHWCDKDEQLFPSMCTLLWLFSHNAKWKRLIKSLPNIEQRFAKIQMQVTRKKSMVKRTGVKGHSVFTPYKTLPLPSCEPDWGLEYKHKPHVFTNSVHAFDSLLRILE